MSTHKRVGLLLLTESEDGQTAVAHLEKRVPGFGGNTAPTWPGIHLVSAGGKVTDDENELMALHRQLKDKFGELPGRLLTIILLENDPEKQILFKNDRITLFGLIMPRELLEMTHSKVRKDGFTRVTEEDLSRLIKAESSWKHQPHKKDGIVVFPETEEALRRAFRKL